MRKIRLTGGEPLVRRDIGDLVRRLGRHVGQDLAELTLTTNGNHVAQHAGALVAAGVRRVSLGGSLSRVAYTALKRAGEELLATGTFDFAEDILSTGALNKLMMG